MREREVAAAGARFGVFPESGEMPSAGPTHHGPVNRPPASFSHSSAAVSGSAGRVVKRYLPGRYRVMQWLNRYVQRHNAVVNPCEVFAVHTGR